MNSLLQNRSAWIIIIMLLITPNLVSCAPNANAMILAPDLAERVAVATIEAQPGYGKPTEVPKPTMLTELTEEEIYAGLPDEIVAALETADPANAESLSLTYGCLGCHQIDPDHEQPAPTWWNMGNIAVTRGAEPNPANYLYTSIVNPDAYVVDEYTAGVMPQNFSEQLSTQELADIVAFLLEQQQATE